MIETLNKIYAFAGKRQALMKKSLVFAFINGLFAAMQFAALFVAIQALLVGRPNSSAVWLSFGLMMFSVLGRIAASIFSMNQQTVVGYGMVADKRISIGDRLKYIPMGYFSRNTIGQLTGVVTNTMTDVENYAPMVLVSVIGGFLNAAALVLCLLCLNWILGLTALAGVALYLFITELATKQSTAVASQRQEAQRRLVDAVMEAIQGMAVLRTFGMERESDRSVTAVIRESKQENSGLVTKVAPYIALQQLIVRLFSVILLLLTVALYLNGRLPMPLGVLFVMTSFLLFGSLESAGSQITMVQMLSASIDTANETDGMPVMDEGGTGITPVDSQIKFEHVSFSYGDRPILRDINVTVPERSMTAIVGPSGSGKTTMCNLIARFWDVDEGRITIGGRDIREFKMDSLMKNISMVFQNVYLFEDTVENNIKFGCPDASHEQVIEAARKACCHEFIMRLPDGYDTRIGEGGSSLSGGEKQRISIARAMLKSASIVILDEATASVDPENEADLQQAIQTLPRDKTVIMIAHRLKTVRSADQILVLDQGRIVQRGTHEELIDQTGLYRSFVQAKEEAIKWKL